MGLGIWKQVFIKNATWEIRLLSGCMAILSFPDFSMWLLPLNTVTFSFQVWPQELPRCSFSFCFHSTINSAWFVSIQHLSLIPQTFKLLFEPLTVRMLKQDAWDYLVHINYLHFLFVAPCSAAQNMRPYSSQYHTRARSTVLHPLWANRNLTTHFKTVLDKSLPLWRSF